ncbi:MAG: nuclease [Nitrobacter sp. 62-23]|nr:MAG: nuclease [Nitrobacter sp. 62-23]
MLVSQRIWRVGPSPERLSEARLASERQLEDMIVAKPEIVSDQWMIIGQQEETGFGGRVDLLAIAPDSSLILIELKRGRSPREVVAQAIDYATWVEALDAEAVARIYARFKKGADLAKDFEARFGVSLDTEVFPYQHQIVIVAAALDAASERIVAYLSKRSVAINVLCFKVFECGVEKLLSRAWLRDPVESQAASATTSKSPSGPWNGEYYVSFGGEGRSWEEAVKYGFISAGGGTWYSNTLKLLKPGDRVWVKIPRTGYVGVGRVSGFSTPQTEFRVSVDGKQVPVSDVLASHQLPDDPEKMEHFVAIEWAETVPEDKAINESGLFSNRNTVCAPKIPEWRTTIDRLQRAFPKYDSV